MSSLPKANSRDDVRLVPDADARAKANQIRIIYSSCVWLLPLGKIALTLIAALVVASTIATAGAANGAQMLKYTLSGVEFSDGTTASGLFLYDPTTGLINPGVTVRIFASSTDSFFVQVYNESVASINGSTEDFHFVGNLQSFVHIDLEVALPLAMSGSTPLLAGSFRDDTNQTPPVDHETVSTGSLIVSTVGAGLPEPTSLVLLATGMAAAVWPFRHRRRRQVVS